MSGGRALEEEDVRRALGEVHDPEIPTVSIVDLGLVEAIRVDGAYVEVDLLPTFAGCPALSLIQEAAERAISAAGAERAAVRFVTSAAWTTDRVTEEGRRALAAFGIAPPDAEVACPYCGSKRTRKESAFGPTLCRQVYYCDACRNPFERMKPVVIADPKR